MSDILTPVARLVSGHPMVSYPMTDDKTGQPRKNNLGEPMSQTSIGLAFAKGAETHWNQTPWGSAIWNAGAAAWPNGEFNAPTFAWKIVDGDSAIPNKKGNKPCDREGYPGHWVLFATTMFSIPTYHAGRYQAHEVIKDKNEIKTGDYVRLSFNAVGNNPSQSPGVYINPVLLELSRAGIAIVSANAPDAATTFGSSTPEVPVNALVDNSVTPPPPVGNVTATAGNVTPPAGNVTPPAGNVTPAHDLVNQPVPGADVTPPPVIETPPPPVEDSYNYNGKVYTKTQLLSMPGWTEAHLAGLQKV